MARPISRAEAVRRRQEAEQTQDKRRKLKLAVLAIFAPILLTALIALAVSWPALVRSVRHERLRSSANQFLRVKGDKAPNAEPHVKGKLIVLDRVTGEIDNVQKHLSDEIRAYGADEVGTVALLEWDFVATHNNSGRLSGHYSTCKVTLVDRDSGLIVDERTVMGATSPVSSGTKYSPPGQQTALRATPQVAGYLQSLPRR